jgi:Glycosyl hydrolases family 31.
MNNSFEICGNALIWYNNGETLQIEPAGKNSLRVRSVMMGEILNTNFALLNFEQIKPEISITENGGEIKNGKITAKVENSGRISCYNQNGKLLLEEIDSHGALRLAARKFKSIIGGDFQLTVTFAAQEDEKIYGMGQYQQEIMDLKYCTLELAHRNSQVSVPFMLSSRGYGFLWHNPAIGRVSFSKNFTEWYAESTKQLDYWITVGDTPAEIVETYIQATGLPPMMPEYGMGFWQSKLRYFNQEQLLEIAREYKRRNLPIDVIVVDFFTGRNKATGDL